MQSAFFVLRGYYTSSPPLCQEIFFDKNCIISVSPETISLYSAPGKEVFTMQNERENSQRSQNQNQRENKQQNDQRNQNQKENRK